MNEEPKISSRPRAAVYLPKEPPLPGCVIVLCAATVALGGILALAWVIARWLAP